MSSTGRDDSADDPTAPSTRVNGSHAGDRAPELAAGTRPAGAAVTYASDWADDVRYVQARRHWPPDVAPVNVFGLAATLVEAWRALLVAALLGAAIAAAITLARPRTYTARMSLVTVTTSKGPSLGGVIGAGLLSIGAGSGVQATPTFVLRLMETESIRRAIALTPVPGTGQPLVTTLGGHDALAHPELFGRTIGRAIESTTDRDAGTIELAATHPDSAIARLMAQRMLEETSRGFLRAARAQATQQREAQERRVEVAQHNLRAAEDALLAFSRSNRVIGSYSSSFVENQQLQRALSIAQSVYTQAVGDRESAVAKELEDTPALVVLDPVPNVIGANPRYTAAKMIAGAVTGMLLVGFWKIVRALMAGPAAPDARRLRAALRTVPVVGRFVRA